MMNDETLILNYVSSYGEEGYTGEVKVTVAYIFNDDNELIIEYMATTNKNGNKLNKSWLFQLGRNSKPNANN